MPGFAEYHQNPANIVRRVVSNSYPRRKPRLLVETMFAEVSGLPAGTFKQLAADQLVEARKKLIAKVSTDALRKQSIIDAEHFYDNAESYLRSANANAVPLQTATLGSAALSESEKQKQGELGAYLDRLEEKIATVNTAGTAGPAVLPNKRELQTSVMLGRAATLRQNLAGAVAGTDFGKIEAEIGALHDRAGELQLFVGAAREKVAELRKPGGLMAQGQLAVATIKIEMKRQPPVRQPPALDRHGGAGEPGQPGRQGSDPGESKLAKLVAALEAASGAMLIDSGGVGKLADELQIEVEAFSKDGSGYVAEAEQQIGAAKRLTVAFQLFDECVNPRMLTLEAIAGPLDDPSLGDMRQRVSQYRGQVPATLAKLEGNPRQKDVVSGLDEAIDGAIDEARKSAETLRQEVAQARIALDAAINPKTGTLAATQAMPVFAADWKQIDSAMMAIQQMLPGSDPLEGPTLANLVAAKRLCAQADVLAKKVEANQPKVGAFDTTLKDLEAAIKTNKEDKTPLGKYDPAAIKAIEEQFKAFKKTQPTLPAETAQSILDELKKTFDARKQAAEEVANYVGTITADMEKWKKWAESASKFFGGVVKKEFNSLQVSLDPLQAALDARPAVKADIEKAYQDASGYFTPLVGDKEALQLAKDSEQGLKDKAALVDQQREELEQRLKVLKERQDVAADRVSKAKGDKNPIEAIARLVKQAADEIKQQPDVAGKTLDRIAQRIDLVYANPEGGLARARRELPELHKEWVTARQNALADLQAVAAKLAEYDSPEDQKKQAVQALADRVTEYTAAFALGPDRLQAPMRVLADANTDEAARRKAREEALAEIGDKLRSLQSHPLTAVLAQSPIVAARAAPKRLFDKLDWLQYSILTSVQ